MDTIWAGEEEAWTQPLLLRCLRRWGAGREGPHLQAFSRLQCCSHSSSHPHLDRVVRRIFLTQQLQPNLDRVARRIFLKYSSCHITPLLRNFLRWPHIARDEPSPFTGTKATPSPRVCVCGRGFCLESPFCVVGAIASLIHLECPLGCEVASLCFIRGS